MLLRSLSYNITATSEKLNLKESADLLYSITVLNFPDENLLERISDEVCNALPDNSDKSAVVGSILTSVGLLRYKNMELLDNLSEWILKHHSICRPQDIFSLFMTLAVVNHLPTNAEQLFKVRTFLICTSKLYVIVFFVGISTLINIRRSWKTANMVRCCLVISFT